MSDKFIIAWPGVLPYSETQIYFKELLFKTSRYDSYGSTPQPTITRTITAVPRVQVMVSVSLLELISYK